MFLLFSLVAGILGAFSGIICGSDWRLIGTVIGVTIVASAIGLWIDPRCEGTQFGVFFGPFAGNVSCAILKRRWRTAVR